MQKKLVYIVAMSREARKLVYYFVSITGKNANEIVIKEYKKIMGMLCTL